LIINLAIPPNIVTPTWDLFPSRRGGDDHWWNICSGVSTRSNHSWLDSNWGGIANQSQFGYQGECATSEHEGFTRTNCHKIADWASKGVQSHFCLNIQRSKGYSTNDYSTQDWSWYHNTTYSLSKVLIES
jgi:hypothetical protein